MKRVAVYLRVSRLDQNPESQRADLERYVTFRQWEPTWFVEHGVSGSKERRPVLDEMMSQVRGGQFEAVLALKIDRLGRNLGHLIRLADELRALGVDLVTVGEGLDTSTPHGRMVFQIIGSFAEFEREVLRERTLRGLDRARREGRKGGRKQNKKLRAMMHTVEGLSTRKAAAQLGCTAPTISRIRKEMLSLTGGKEAHQG